MTAELVAVGGTQHENLELRRTLVLQQRLSALASHDVGLETLIELIAEATDTALAVVDETLQVRASGGLTREIKTDDLLSERLRARGVQSLIGLASTTRSGVRSPFSDSTGRSVLIAPICVGDEVTAHLVALDDHHRATGGEDLALLVHEHAAAVCGLALAREQRPVIASAAARDDLLQGLLSGTARSPQELHRWAAHLGYDETTPHRVVSLLLDGRSDVVARVSVAAERYVLNRVPGAMSTARGREITLVCPEATDRTNLAQQVGASCLAAMTETYADLTITGGVSGPARAAADIASACRDARGAVEILGRAGRGGSIAGIDDLGIHRLLLQTGDRAHLEQFVITVFGQLVTHPQAGSTDSLQTLACYFRENNSPQRASRVLHVHPNTVAYRVRRVEELTNLNFQNYQDRLMAQIALEVLDIVGHPVA